MNEISRLQWTKTQTACTCELKVRALTNDSLMGAGLAAKLCLKKTRGLTEVHKVTRNIKDMHLGAHDEKKKMK